MSRSENTYKRESDPVSSVIVQLELRYLAEMTINTPLRSLMNRLSQAVIKDDANPSPQLHYEVLQMIDQLRSAVESPTETVLRLIYQVGRPRRHAGFPF